jgi:hypothetical protein
VQAAVEHRESVQGLARAVRDLRGKEVQTSKCVQSSIYRSECVRKKRVSVSERAYTQMSECVWGKWTLVYGCTVPEPVDVC